MNRKNIITEIITRARARARGLQTYSQSLFQLQPPCKFLATFLKLCLCFLQSTCLFCSLPNNQLSDVLKPTQSQALKEWLGSSVLLKPKLLQVLLEVAQEKFQIREEVHDITSQNHQKQPHVLIASVNPLALKQDIQPN